jgi:hypothetical protein
MGAAGCRCRGWLTVTTPDFAAVLPTPSVAVTITVGDPAAVNACETLVPVAVEPSPKLQDSVTGPQKSVALAEKAAGAPTVAVAGIAAPVIDGEETWKPRICAAAAAPVPWTYAARPSPVSSIAADDPDAVPASVLGELNVAPGARVATISEPSLAENTSRA